jgi:hypothetical protein
MSTRTRTTVALVLFMALCLPLGAQTAHGRSLHEGWSWTDSLYGAWNRLTHFVAPGLTDRGTTVPGIQTKGRGACDPNGVTQCDPTPTSLQGAGGCDPNGCGL